MRNKLLPSLSLLVFLGAGCASSAPSPGATSGTQAPNPTANLNSGLKTCASYGSSHTDFYNAGVDTLSPADFPKPPAGAQLCGSSNQLEWVYYILANGNAHDILSYYQTELTKQGFTNMNVSADAINFDNGQKLGSGQYISGSVSYDAKTGALGIGYHSDVWRKAHGK